MRLPSGPSQSVQPLDGSLPANGVDFDSYRSPREGLMGRLLRVSHDALQLKWAANRQGGRLP